MKSLNNILIATLLALSINPGCGYKLGVEKSITHSFSAGANLRNSGESVKYKINLDKNIQSTSIVVWDSFEDRTTVRKKIFTDISEGKNTPQRLGLEGYLKFKGIKLKTGADVRLENHSGFHATSESYSKTAFSSFVPGQTYNKYLGMELELFHLHFGMEYGIPTTKFSFQSGLEEYGNKMPFKKDSWHGKGKSIGANVGFNFDILDESHPFSVFVEMGLRKDEYHPVFLGTKNHVEVSSKSVNAGICVPIGKR